MYIHTRITHDQTPILLNKIRRSFHGFSFGTFCFLNAGYMKYTSGNSEISIPHEAAECGIEKFRVHC